MIDPWLLPFIWALVIATGVVVYVMLDGFDLGVGILFPLAPESAHRDRMMNSVAPVWDGNETWLVLGGAGLMAAFPVAYAVLLSSLYVPIMLMLTALIFRGVAFEFRFKARQSRFLWDIAFSGGSTVAAFCQGIVLGAVVQGLDVVDQRYVGGPFDWLTPFTLFTGFAVVLGYGLLGATWLIMKTDGLLQHWCYRQADRLWVAVLACMLIVSLWTPLMEPEIRDRWFSLPNLFFLAPVPLAAVIVALYGSRALVERREQAPFWASLALFLLGYVGLVVSIWPYIIPRAVTFVAASSPPASQEFALIGVVLFLPVVIFYTVMGYRIFAGKVSDAGYH
ncbi:MAG TPA: cytochrome d ubiquinol oxidase subunit II [Gammaproteobacteria bacterium]|nr:cytochrome d ubiquinol oxidase subunit II [Gammaproteobacteria bacterium]